MGPSGKPARKPEACQVFTFGRGKYQDLGKNAQHGPFSKGLPQKKTWYTQLGSGLGQIASPTRWDLALLLSVRASAPKPDTQSSWHRAVGASPMLDFHFRRVPAPDPPTKLRSQSACVVASCNHGESWHATIAGCKTCRDQKRSCSQQHEQVTPSFSPFSAQTIQAIPTPNASRKKHMRTPNKQTSKQPSLLTKHLY